MKRKDGEGKPEGHKQEKYILESYLDSDHTCTGYKQRHF
jgi:hypothetical protein